MSYNFTEIPNNLSTAGKITVFTVLSSICIFAVVFLFNVGKTEFERVEAQSTATTSIRVLNTPPNFIVGQEGREEVESSTSTPTNSGDEVAWIGTAFDANGEDYYMIICSNGNTPIPGVVPGLPPSCDGGIQWGVSALTSSTQQARVATTTTEALPFVETNTWYAFVCDAVSNARCSASSSQGTNATNSTPFNVNRRPTFTGIGNDGPANPGATLTWTATADDPDGPPDDTVRVHICYENDYSTSTNSCGPGGYIASTTIPGPTSNPTAVAVLASIFQDDTYDAFVFVHDNHGHEAEGIYQGTSSPFTVNNVAPLGVSGSVTIEDTDGLGDLTLTNPGGETTGFSLTFEVRDANSCSSTAGLPEIEEAVVSLFRSGVGSSSCTTSGDFDQNNCYNNSVPTTTWDIVCTASSTQCTHTDLTPDDTALFECTFPLQFITDPTAPNSFYDTQNWLAAIGGVDDDGVTTTNRAVGATPQEVALFPAFNLADNAIDYIDLEPGQNTSNTNASTTVENLGNTGINQLLSGTDMCPSAVFAGPGCNTFLTTSTIQVANQKFSATTFDYTIGGTTLASSTAQELAIQVPKPVTTIGTTTDEIYWGIAVPGAITTAGAYTGQNTFQVSVSASSTWGL